MAEKNANTPDFYSNAVQFESSVWDLKLHFRQLDQSGEKADLEHRGTVTVPWLQAKIMLFYLQLNLAIHEDNNGTVSVPTSVLPIPPDEIDKGDFFSESLKALYRQLYSKMFAPAE